MRCVLFYCKGHRRTHLNQRHTLWYDGRPERRKKRRIIQCDATESIADIFTVLMHIVVSQIRHALAHKTIIIYGLCMRLIFIVKKASELKKKKKSATHKDRARETFEIQMLVVDKISAKKLNFHSHPLTRCVCVHKIHMQCTIREKNSN